jgi:hypothetical protein
MVIYPHGDAMAQDKLAGSQWIKGILRAEMAKKAMTYADLAICLHAIGVEEDEKNLANKIGRGNFTAILFMQCLSAMGLRSLNFEPWGEYIYITLQEQIEMGEAYRKSLANLSGGAAAGPGGPRRRKHKADD